ncbi:tRNA 4-thiouridine(8) synthase ThiI [Candidatus Woesearchaeota archaeon]|nr:tRNA 4-thiouridine(8) synthase ThiI [Candidatus Woesearchaeota archaeon]
MKSELIILKSAEILLKGTPVRRKFEAQLIRNIRAKLKSENISYTKINKTHSRFLIYTNETEKALNALKKVFGIVSLSPAIKIKTNLETIQSAALKFSKLTKNKSFAVRAKRVTKDFKQTSQEINETVGAYLQKQTKANVDLDNPDITINIELIGKTTYLFTKTTKGFGGLPVGTQGKIVCLMSGGMDSPVAAWMMLKRGCEIIPLHLRISKDEHQKFLKLVKQLQKFSAGHKIKPKVIAWKPKLEKLTKKLKSKNKLSWTCIFCKHQMLLEAEKLAEKQGAKAICIGSSLGQVASQTLDNIAVTHHGIEIPILTPLIGFNKDETEKLARELETYEIAAKGAGAAVCPFLPSKPRTAANLNKFKELKNQLK